MTEPTLEAGDNWEDFLKRTLIEKCSVELAMETDQPWIRDELRPRLDELRFHAQCAEVHIGVEAQEIDW